MQKYPFVRILIAWITGLLIADCYQLSSMTCQLLSGLLLVCLFLFSKCDFPTAYRLRWLPGLLISSLISMAGMMTLEQRTVKNEQGWIGSFQNPVTCIQMVVEETPILRKKSKRFCGRIVSVYDQDSWKPSSGKVLVYMNPTDKANSLRANTLLISNASLHALEKDSFFATDYKKYLARHGIYHRLYLKDDNFLISEKKEHSFFREGLEKLHTYTLQTLRTAIRDSMAYSLAEALLIGYRNDMDKLQLSTYTDAGVVHIIAISGMHLGLLYLILQVLIIQIPFIQKRKWLTAGILLFFLWMFTLLCGASASVLRSAVMYTLLIVGKTCRQDLSFKNMLAASAYLLLWHDPYLLWDVGFQLSYLAIIGIVWLQKPLLRLYTFTSWLPQKIWEMSSLTLAAQIMTFPLCLFYFHQFPNYFLLSNMLAIPLSTLILLMEICLFVVKPFPWLFDLGGKATQQMIYLFEQSMHMIASWPGAVASGIYANVWTTIWLYIALILLGWGLLKKNKLYCWSSLASFTCYSLSYAYFAHLC